MWLLRIQCILLFGLTVISCGERKKALPKAEKIQPSLIHPLFFQEEIAGLMNFPFWFNDSIVSKNNIQQITMTSYKGIANDTVVSAPDVDVTFPKRIVVYTFNRAGGLIHIQISNFSEGIIISYQSFQVNAKNASGFAKILIKENAYGIENNTPVFSIQKQNKFVTTLIGSDEETVYHFIQNKQLQGPISVDSLVHPLPSDWVVLGVPNRPEKRYKVKNTVKEKQVSTYEYATGNFPLKIQSEEYPFIRKRFFNYNHGVFCGYEDSIFIDATFVTSVNTSIYLNKSNIPKRIVHKKEHVDGVRNFETYETFDYVFYE
jgi:hypothetical protein